MSTIEHTRPDSRSNQLAPVIEDMSSWIIAGQTVSKPKESEYESMYRTPAQGIQDAIDAERLGLRRVWLSERWNFKEAGTFLGACAASTTRLEVGTGVIPAATRHPQLCAAMGATMHSMFGPRFILGLGLGVQCYFDGMGLRSATYKALVDYVDIIRRLWRGESVDYEGPAGSYQDMTLGYPFDWPAPEIWFGTFANPKGAKVAAAAFDGVQLAPLLTAQATYNAVKRIREECEKIGRDPASIRICQPVITCADLDDVETKALTNGRAVTYLTAPPYSTATVQANGWDPKIVEKMCHHQQVGTRDKVADWGLHRADLVGPGSLLPDEWMKEANAIGTVAECVKALQDRRDAGADEVALYGSAPSQNAKVIAAWRNRPEAASA